MRYAHVGTLVLFFSILVGCTGTRNFALPTISIKNGVAASSASTKPHAVSEKASQAIKVSLYRLPQIAIPLSNDHGTLRTAVAKARDAAGSESISNSFMANLIPNGRDNVVRAALEELEIAEENLADEELVILHRGDTWIVIPNIIVNSTSVGAISVSAGDAISSVPSLRIKNFLSGRSETIAQVVSPSLTSFEFTPGKSLLGSHLFELETVPGVPQTTKFDTELAMPNLGVAFYKIEDISFYVAFPYVRGQSEILNKDLAERLAKKIPLCGASTIALIRTEQFAATFSR